MKSMKKCIVTKEKISKRIKLDKRRSNKRRSSAGMFYTSSAGAVTSLILMVAVFMFSLAGAINLFGLNGSAYATDYTISMTSSGAQSINVAPGNSGTGTSIGVDNITVSTTCRAGYNFTISTSVNDNNLYLDGSSSNNSSYFSPADGTSTLADSTNKWGYYYNDSAPTTAPTPSNVFSAIPALGSTAATIKTPTASATDIEDHFNIYYGVSINSGLAPGAYKMIQDANNSNNAGTVVYYLTMAGSCAKQYMQDMDDTKLAELMPNNGDTTTLYDKRDESDYQITKINNRYWMTQNLRITNTTGQATGTILAENSNFSTDLTFDGDLTAGNSYTAKRYHIPTTTDLSTLGLTVDQTGVWYNYCAASAGTVCNNTEAKDATEDICPDGWRLPNNSELDAITNSASNFSPVSSGYYATKKLYTSPAYWWSATASSKTEQYRLSYDGSTLSSDTSNKMAGFSIRCIAKSNSYTITYNANGGTGSVASQTVAADGTFTAANNGFSRTGYYFKGWAISPTAATRKYRPGQASIAPTGDMTLYAVWGESTNTTLYDIVGSLTIGNLSATNLKKNPTRNASGVFTYNKTTFGTPSDAGTNAIYFYRGILDSTVGTYGSDGDGMNWPNYVKLGTGSSATCWRIVRTTGSKGVKMIYNGLYGATTSGSCANATTKAEVTTEAFGGTNAAVYNSIVGVGYTRNNTYASTSATTATAYSTIFGNDSNYAGNSTDSTIKYYIENTWFSNISSYESKLESNAGYCNDRTLNEGTSWTDPVSDSTTIVPYGTSGMTAYYFGSYIRNKSATKTPSLTCPRATVDLYSTSGASAGNKQLKKPVALLTADEASFAGSGSSTASEGSGYHKNSYLRSGSDFWLLSPYCRYSFGFALGFALYSNGSLDGGVVSVDDTYGVRPAISLTSGTTPASGSGTATDPWIVNP